MVFSRTLRAFSAKFFPQSLQSTALQEREPHHSLSPASSDRTPRAPGTLQIPIEPRLAPPLPIPVPVIINPRTRTQEAKERMSRWTNHNPHMPSPDNQIPRLRPRYPLKSLHPVVQIIRRRVRVRKPRSLINRMHQVGAIALSRPRILRAQRHPNHRLPILRT